MVNVCGHSFRSSECDGKRCCRIDMRHLQPIGRLAEDMSSDVHNLSEVKRPDLTDPG